MKKFKNCNEMYEDIVNEYGLKFKLDECRNIENELNEFYDKVYCYVKYDDVYYVIGNYDEYINIVNVVYDYDYDVVDVICDEDMDDYLDRLICKIFDEVF